MKEELTQEHLKMMQKGISLFNQGLYWDCHEELEGPWMECQHQPVRYIFWAIIQVATALYHFENGNLVGATSMLRKSREKFKLCEKIDWHPLKKQLSWDILRELVFEIPENPKREDFLKLYGFRFKEIL